MHIIINGARLFFNPVGEKLVPAGPRTLLRDVILNG